MLHGSLNKFSTLFEIIRKQNKQPDFWITGVNELGFLMIRTLGWLNSI